MKQSIIILKAIASNVLPSLFLAATIYYLLRGGIVSHLKFAISITMFILFLFTFVRQILMLTQHGFYWQSFITDPSSKVKWQHYALIVAIFVVLNLLFLAFQK